MIDSRILLTYNRTDLWMLVRRFFLHQVSPVCLVTMCLYCFEKQYVGCHCIFDEMLAKCQVWGQWTEGVLDSFVAES